VDALKKQFQAGKDVWEKHILSLKKVSELKNQLDRLKFDLEVAERKQAFEEAGKIKYSLIPAVQKQLETIGHHWVLGVEHVAQVISRQTGIPLEKILKSKQEKVLELEGYLQQHIYGQDEVLKEMSETLVAAHAGLTDETRPLGSFLLLGPTGVGKTETVKGVCRFLFHSEKNLIRFDMSEFSEKHSVAKLIGAPAGYVGYEEGGVLTEAVRRRPYAVILFDEIEKAHPEFADILLQILDDGRLTDNKGRTVSFKNTIIFLTSNSKQIELDFRPEVLGRFDQMLTYKSLDASIMKKLVAKQVAQLNERLKTRHLALKLEAPLEQYLMERGYVPQYGARPLQSVFQKILVRPLAKAMLEAKEPWAVEGGHQKERLLKASWNGQDVIFQ
jgi:ATP-dependent Clp protease ATP-binding subunit ClpB